MASDGRILVVDDESDLREMLTRSFSREGHRVLAVAEWHPNVGTAALAQHGKVETRVEGDHVTVSRWTMPVCSSWTSA